MLGQESPIINVSTGRLNTVNDTYIGGQPAGSGSTSLYAGQLGKILPVSSENIAQLFSSSVGTLYAGEYRYVKMRADDDDSPALTPGKILFWDTTVTSWQTAYQVTRDENLSSVDNAVAIAGIYLGGFTPGNYGFIFVGGGICPVRFRSVLTVAGAIGCRVYAAGAGDLGNDQGTADVLTTDSTSVANARYLGIATAAAPAAAGLSNVFINYKNYIG